MIVPLLLTAPAIVALPIWMPVTPAMIVPALLMPPPMETRAPTLVPKTWMPYPPDITPPARFAIEPVIVSPAYGCQPPAYT